jgi:nucleoside-diphosphate-sugar epimerase
MSAVVPTPPTWVIFGAGGFVGSHLCRHLLQLPGERRVVLSDIRFPEERVAPAVREAIASGRFEQVIADLRQPIDAAKFPSRVDVIVNLAAICREPDFPPKDFFEVNVVGGRNVARWAEKVDCPQILFTSSIAVYGGDRGRITEETLPVPFHAYGSSKLAAEEIFRGWRYADSQNRSLTILRPGVIYGPGENANVYRLIRAVRRGYFFYCGNRDLPKAGAYVDELCRALTWMQSQEAGKGRLVIANFASQKPPTLSEYVETIKEISGWRRWIPSVPYRLLLGVATVFNAFTSLFGITTPIHPRRVEKLRIANDVIPQYLIDQGYPFHYTLEQGLKRWREEAPAEWS